MSAPGPQRPQQPGRARPTPVFFALAAVAVVCALTMVLARRGTLAGLAFLGLVLSVFVLLNAALAPAQPRRELRRRRRAQRREEKLQEQREHEGAPRPPNPFG